MKTITVKGNKLVRITENEVKVGLCRIIKDGVVFFHASSVLTPIVWNNIIGANFENKEEHSKYCEHMGVKSGVYVFACEADAYSVTPLKQIDCCLIKVN